MKQSHSNLVAALVLLFIVFLVLLDKNSGKDGHQSLASEPSIITSGPGCVMTKKVWDENFHVGTDFGYWLDDKSLCRRFDSVRNAQYGNILKGGVLIDLLKIEKAGGGYAYLVQTNGTITQKQWE